MKSSSTYIAKYKAIAGYLLIIVIWVIWCLYFLQKGIDFTDEGLHISEAWRLSQGDVLFRDSQAAWGLSPWFFSWIFYIYPECSLLGIRIIWASMLLLCALLAAHILYRYFNPFICAAGVTIGLLFASYWGLKTLNYVNMPILGLILASWLWINALKRNQKYPIFLAFSAGLIAFLANTCRISLIPLLILPIVTLIYDHICNITTKNWLKISLSYLSGYLSGLILFLLITFASGRLADFQGSLLTIGNVLEHSPSDVMKNFFTSCFFYLIPSLVIVPLIAVAKHKSIIEYAKLHTRAISIIAAIIIAFLLIIIIGWPVFKKSLSLFKTGMLSPISFSGPLSWQGSPFLLLAFIICIVMIDIVFHVFERDCNAKKAVHERSRLSVIALFILFLMIVGTASVPATAVLQFSFIPVAMATGIIWLRIPRFSRTNPSRNAFTVSLSTLCLTAILLFCAATGIGPNRVPFRDSYFTELTTIPKTPKLDYVFTTADRSRVIDQLVEAVKTYTKDGDRILAYDNIPMIYYLTNRRPATNITFLWEGDRASLRQQVLEDMINRNRLPSLVIRAGYSTCVSGWPTEKVPTYINPDPKESINPIDTYIYKHYKIVRYVDEPVSTLSWTKGFLIMVPADN